jgi:hypothetical protein
MRWGPFAVGFQPANDSPLIVPAELPRGPWSDWGLVNRNRRQRDLIPFDPTLSTSR